MNASKHNSSQDIRNFKTEIRGSLYVEVNVDGGTVYSLRDTVYWSVSKQQWIALTPNDPDKFTVTAETFEIAKEEFWFRWKTYVKRVFHRNYVPLDIVTHITNN